MGFFSGFKKFSDFLGTILTVSGLMLIPFLGVATANVMAAAATAGTVATKGAALGAFHAPLFTNATTGSVGLFEGISSLFTGLATFVSSGADVVGQGLAAAFNGEAILPAMENSLNSPAPSFG